MTTPTSAARRGGEGRGGAGGGARKAGRKFLKFPLAGEMKIWYYVVETWERSLRCGRREVLDAAV